MGRLPSILVGVWSALVDDVSVLAVPVAARPEENVPEVVLENLAQVGSFWPHFWAFGPFLVILRFFRIFWSKKRFLEYGSVPKKWILLAENFCSPTF